MAVSGKKLLQWETAAQTDADPNGLGAHLAGTWFAPVCGAVCLGFSASVIGRTAGLVWLCAPVTAWALSLPARKNTEPTEAQRRCLTGWAARLWTYFDRFCAEEEHFLPPDNVQQQPPVGAAHRTSPTNIGLALVSCLAALDLGIDARGTAMERCLARGSGPHGLLRFGSGDWNDGLDRIGGESVWLTWFFSHVAARFSRLLGKLCQPDSEKYAALAVTYGQAADAAWDGGWYLRGYWPDGERLGSRVSRCCQIDSIAQSWAALCEQAAPEKVSAALGNAVDRLFDRETGVVKLFDPPFADCARSPGYLESYGPGFRENGGQYTHGAIWLAMYGGIIAGLIFVLIWTKKKKISLGALLDCNGVGLIIAQSIGRWGNFMPSPPPVEICASELPTALYSGF